MACITGFEGEDIVFRMDDGSSKSIPKTLCDFVPQVGMEVEIREEGGRFTLVPRSPQRKMEEPGHAVPLQRGELKRTAKERIHGNILKLLPLSLCSILPMLCSAWSPFLGWLAALFLIPCIELGCVHIYLALFDQKRWSLDLLSEGFKPYWRCVGLAFLRNLYICLWGCLFIIPGIVKSISYSQALYIFAEHPDMEPGEAISASRKMMQGHKWEFFLFALSFLGWFLLSLLTCGILLVYVAPYWQEAQVAFYRSLGRRQK